MNIGIELLTWWAARTVVPSWGNAHPLFKIHLCSCLDSLLRTDTGPHCARSRSTSRRLQRDRQKKSHRHEAVPRYVHINNHARHCAACTVPEMQQLLHPLGSAQFAVGRERWTRITVTASTLGIARAWAVKSWSVPPQAVPPGTICADDAGK